jgi:hypothetical protein
MIFEFNDYLKIDDEIQLNKLASEIDMKLILNELQMKNFNEETCFNKMTELYMLYNKLMELNNRAIMHNNHYVSDMCEVYLVETDYQMHELRNKVYR